MKFQEMKVKKPFSINLDDKNSFQVIEMKKCGNKLIASGFHSGEIYPQKATLSIELKEEINNSIELKKACIKEWIIDTEFTENLYTVDQVMSVLQCGRDTAWRITKNILPEPKLDKNNKKFWNINEVLKVKPFISKSKWELIRYAVRGQF